MHAVIGATFRLSRGARGPGLLPQTWLFCSQRLPRRRRKIKATMAQITHLLSMQYCAHLQPARTLRDAPANGLGEAKRVVAAYTD
jgi:hypothetical protein